MLALGVVIVSRSSTFTGDLVTILFGQVLGTSVQSLLIQGVATVVVVAVAMVCARPFLLLSFDPEQADVAGFPSRRYHAIMLLLVALTVVVSFQTVGTLLVFGMLIAPASRRSPARPPGEHDDGSSRASWVSRAAISGCSPATGGTSREAPRWCSSRRSCSSRCSCSSRGEHRGRGPRPAPAMADSTVVTAFEAVRGRHDRGTGRRRPRRSAVGYPGDVVVDGIDLPDPPRVASLALVGTNGSGKSTLLRTLVGLLRPVQVARSPSSAAHRVHHRRVSRISPSPATPGSSCRCRPSTSCAWRASRIWGCWAG